MPQGGRVRRGTRVVRLGWGVADQALSSLTNMALSLLVARALGPRTFGTFSLAFATYLVALGASRALNAQPLVVRYTGASSARWKQASGSASGSAVLIGIVAGLGCGAVGWAAGGPTGTMFVALGLSLPGLLAQDAWRYAFFASGKGGRAFANDLAWAVLLLPLIVGLSINGTLSAAWYTLAWGAAATGAAVIGAVQAGILPRVTDAGNWWRENRSLAPGFLGEFAASSGTSNLTTFLVAGVAGMEAVGSIRAAEILMGPLNVLFWGISLAAVPEGVRLLRRSSTELRRWSLLLSSLMPVAALLWGTAVYLLPSAVGHVLLGGTWEGASPLIIPLALARAGVELRAGAGIGLRALGAAGSCFRGQVVSGALWIIGGATGAALADASGAAWGFAFATPIAAAAWWWLFARSLRAHEAEGRSTAPRATVEPVRAVRTASGSDVATRSRIELGTSGGQP